MSINTQIPDYELDDLQIVSSPQELGAMAHRVRSTVLDLLPERAATVSELAAAIHRPHSTVAYHVGVLVEAGMLKVVRTRKVRAIDERFYGRTARNFYVGVQPEQVAELTNLLTVAAAESNPAHEADDLRAILRHARIPRERAAEFWERVFGSPASSPNCLDPATRSTGSWLGFTRPSIPPCHPETTRSPRTGAGHHRHQRLHLARLRLT